MLLLDKSLPPLIHSAPTKLMITSGEIRQEKRTEEPLEDAVDQELRKEDGWIRVNEGARVTKVNDFIAVCLLQSKVDLAQPWNIEQLEPWKSMDLGHLPFHSWCRKNGDLYSEPLKIPNSTTSASKLVRVVSYSLIFY